MKKYMKITVILYFWGVMFLLAGCGKGRVPKEKDIIQDLQEAEYNEIIRGSRHIEMQIDSLQIDDERGDDKERIVYCIIDMHNEDIKVTLYYELYYVYYNKGGWQLEDCMEWKKGEYTPLSGVDVQEAIDELKNDYNYAEIELVTEETNLEACEAQLIFDTYKFWDNCTTTEQVTAEYTFERGLWKRDNIVTETISVDFSPLVGKTYKSEMEGIEVNFIAMDEENKTITLEYLDLLHDSATWQQKTVRYVVVDNVMYIERVYYSFKDFFGYLHYGGAELWVNETGTGRIENHCLILYSDDTDKGVSGQMIEQYY